MGKQYYHFCTNGLNNVTLFWTPQEYAYGMILMGLITILFNIKVYAFVLMPNHIHIILSGTGEECVKAFDYLRKKISEMLVKDGRPSLPEEYDFVIVPVCDPLQMKKLIAYVLRNPLEKNLSTPCGYPWGSGWIYHSSLSGYFSGTKADDISVRELRRMCCSKVSIPKQWQFHPDLGILPESFVDKSLVNKLFPSAKDMETYLIKDYESYVRIARDVGETLEFTEMELRDIVNLALLKHFSVDDVNDLSPEAKSRLVCILSSSFDLSPKDISRCVFLKETIVRQILSSKEYRPHLN